MEPDHSETVSVKRRYVHRSTRFVTDRSRSIDKTTNPVEIVISFRRMDRCIRGTWGSGLVSGRVCFCLRKRCL